MLTTDIYKLFISLIFFVIAGGQLFAQSEMTDKPEPRRGFYTGLTTGGLYYLDDTDRQLYENSFMIGIKAGYDIWKYVAVEGQFRFAGNNSSREGSANAGIPQSFLVYQTIGLLKLSYPITRRFSVFGDFGGGAWISDPNQRANVGSATRGMVTGGLGLQYFLKIRGLAIGLDPSLSSVRDLKGLVFQGSGYVRYTF